MSGRSRGDDQPAGSEQPLDRQLGRAAIRSQRLFNRSFERLSELEALLLGLIDSLVTRGVVNEADVRAASERMAAELGERDDAAPHAVDLRTDDPAGRPELVVDCARRMPVCQAVCCKLAVTLSAAEVESGRLRWDLGRPYQLRREKDGWCSHNERGTGRCTVYADRPGPCRQYSCATDGRIWKDFEAMELNHEWIDAHVGHDEPRLIPVESLRRGAG
jgi:Fe-S-cluster containining protein